MDESSSDRKARLAALRKNRKAQTQTTPPATSETPVTETDGASEPQPESNATLHISPTETVETVSAAIEAEVLRQIQQDFDKQSGTRVELAPTSYTADLERDLANDLSMARRKTEQKITQIIREQAEL